MRESHPEEQSHTGLPPLVPPDRTSQSSPKQNRTALVLIFFCLFSLLGGAALVIFLLPRNQESAGSKTQVALPEPSPGIEKPNILPTGDRTPDALLITPERKEAYSLKVQAEAQDLPRWAPDEYAAVVKNLSIAEALLSQRKYQQATELFRKSSSEITHLLEARQAMFQDLLRDGAQALQENDSQKALKISDKALVLYPDSNEAMAIRQQAQTRAEVLQLYDQVLDLERHGNYAAAAPIVEKIRTIDPGFKPALEADSRITIILRNQTVQMEMNTFYQSLEQADFSAARGSFERLQRLEADNPLVVQAGRLLNERLEVSAINGLRVKAEQQAAAEQWQGALKTYQEILTINPDTMFAINGSLAANKRVELDKNLEETVAQPDRLQDLEVRKEASLLLTYAEHYLPGGSRLATQIDTLRNMLDWARTEIQVTLESDNQTDITIYHVGRLGRFISRGIGLVPGTYTIVGTRTGYRDIRKTVQIGQKNSDIHFIIACKEPI